MTPPVIDFLPKAAGLVYAHLCARLSQVVDPDELAAAGGLPHAGKLNNPINVIRRRLRGSQYELLTIVKQGYILKRIGDNL